MSLLSLFARSLPERTGEQKMKCGRMRLHRAHPFFEIL